MSEQATPAAPAPDGADAVRERRLCSAALAAYGALLLFFARRLTVFEDEAHIISTARFTPREAIEAFVHGAGLHQHPPLYDVLLHGWMQLGWSDPMWLRLPSVLFTLAALALLAASARRLGGRPLPTLLVAMAWPAGIFHAVPAHWMPLTLLGVSAATWSWLRALGSGRPRDFALFAACALALVYTNYLGLLFLGAFVLHAALRAWRARRSPDARMQRRRLGAAGVAIVGVLALASPLAATFARVVANAMRGASEPLQAAVQGALRSGYYAYVLLAGETVAPWQWPALAIAAGIVLLGVAALRAREARWMLAALGLVYLPSAWLGVTGARRVGIFGPWLVLYLGSLVVHARARRAALAGLALVFGVAWLGLARGEWRATHRYWEPWREVASDVLHEARPGDLVVASHPSFFFYLHTQGGWPGWPRADAIVPFERGGVTWAAPPGAAALAAEHQRVLWVRSVQHPPWAHHEARLEALLERAFRLTGRERYLRDPSASLKSRILAQPQPEWRIERLRFERRRRPVRAG